MGLDEGSEFIVWIRAPLRARGVAGGESITLRVNNSNVATWTLGTAMQNYTASTTLSGGITVADQRAWSLQFPGLAAGE